MFADKAWQETTWELSAKPWRGPKTYSMVTTLVGEGLDERHMSTSNVHQVQIELDVAAWM